MAFIASAVLLKLALPIVSECLSALSQQLNTVEDMALSPLREMVGQVTDGVWIGEGADAFVDEVSSLVIPGVGQVGSQIGGFSDSIQRAADVVEQADQAANRLVDGVVQTFSRIF